MSDNQETLNTFPTTNERYPLRRTRQRSQRVAKAPPRPKKAPQRRLNTSAKHTNISTKTHPTPIKAKARTPPRSSSSSSRQNSITISITPQISPISVSPALRPINHSIDSFDSPLSERTSSDNDIPQHQTSIVPHTETPHTNPSQAITTIQTHFNPEYHVSYPSTPRSDIEEAIDTPTTPQLPSLLTSSLTALPRITNSIITRIAHNITPPTISPNALLRALITPNRNQRQPDIRALPPPTDTIYPNQTPHNQYTQHNNHIIPYQNRPLPHPNTPFRPYTQQQIIPYNPPILHHPNCRHAPQYTPIPQRYTPDNPTFYPSPFNGYTIPIQQHQPQHPNTAPPETLPQTLQVPTQPTTHTTTIPTAIQTDPNYTCPNCSWICNTEADSPKTLYIRALFLQQLIKPLRQIEDFIHEKFGRWAEIITCHAFPSTPPIIVTTLIQILDKVSAIGETKRKQHTIPTALIKYLAYAHNSLVSLYRVNFLTNLILPLTYYTTTPRWPYTIPPLIHKIRNTLLTFYTSIPEFLRIRSAGITSPLLDEIIIYFERIINHESDILENYAYKKSLTNTPEHTPEELIELDRDNTTQHRAIPNELRNKLYVPYVRDQNLPYTIDTLFHAYYNPTIDRNLLHYEQFSYLTNTVYNRSERSSRQQPHQPSQPLTPNVHETEVIEEAQRISIDSPIFYEVLESPTPIDNMASRSAPQNHRDDTPPANHHAKNDATNTTNQQTTNNDAFAATLQENITKAIEVGIQQLWHKQIAPQMARRDKETRDFMDDVQHQINTRRRSYDEPTRISPTTPLYNNDNNQRRSSHSNQTQYPSYPRISEPPSDAPNYNETWHDTQDNTQNHRQEQSYEPPPVQTNNQTANTTIVPYKAKRGIDLDQFITGRDNPILTEDDMERFARKTLDELSDAQIRAFADQLEQYLTQNPNDTEHNAEGRALRKLTQHIQPRHLGSWLQLYINPGIQFTYPKTCFWRKKYEEHAHRCMPRQTKKPDMTDCFEKLTRIIEERLPQLDNNNPRYNQNSRNPNQQRNYNNNNNNNNYNNNYNRNNQNQNNYQDRNDYQNRNDYNRNNQQYSNNNNNFRPQYNNNQSNNYQNQQRNNYDNRQQQPYQQRQNQQQQQQRPNNYNNYDNRNNQPQQQQQRNNNYDNRNNQPRYNNQNQNNDRRNQNFNTNNMDDIEQDFNEITLHEECPSFDDLANIQQDNDMQDEQDFQ